MSDKTVSEQSLAAAVKDRGLLLRAMELVAHRLGRKTTLDAAALTGLDGEPLPRLTQELCRGLDLVARVRHAQPEQALAYVGPGSVGLVPTRRGWLVASRSSGVEVQPLRTRSVSLDPRRLDELLLPDAPWIIMEPRLGLEAMSRRSLGSASPWARLRALISLEATDLRALVAYSVVLGGLTLAVPVAVQVLVNTIALGSLLQPLVILAALLLGTLVLAGVVQLLGWYAVEVLQRKVFVRVAEDLARRLPLISYAVHDTTDLREMSNRFFEAASLQKSLNKLLLDGLALLLQTVVGMVLLSLYHPVLLGFASALLLGCLTVVALGYGTVRTAVAESKAKYRLAAWLENLASFPTLFRRRPGADVGVVVADGLTRGYLTERRRHFRRVLRQLTASLGLQVISMVLLLGLGGALVMRGELTLGQLVAAELVVGAVAAGMAKLGKHFETGYDLLASLDKVGALLDLPRDAPGEVQVGPMCHLELHGVTVQSRGTEHRPIELRLQPGRHIALVGGRPALRSRFLEVVTGLREPKEGQLKLFDPELGMLSLDGLRERAMLLRSGAVFDGTLWDNLTIVAPNATVQQVRDALHAVHLLDVVDGLEAGLQTRLLPGGAPLAPSEVARLCLARLRLGRPSVAAIDGLIDAADYDEAELPSVLDWVLSSDAPWSVVLTSRDEVVAGRCLQRLPLELVETAPIQPEESQTAPPLESAATPDDEPETSQ